MDLKKLLYSGVKTSLYAGLAATYLTLSGCGAAATQATTTAPETTTEQVPEATPERECPPRLMGLAINPWGVEAHFDTDGDLQIDYLEIRMVRGGQIMRQPIIYGRDLNRDGSFRTETPGEMQYDPRMDGENGNEMTPEEYIQHLQERRENPTPSPEEHPTSPLESRL